MSGSDKPAGAADDNSMSAVLARAKAAMADLARDYRIWARADIDACRTHLDAARADPDARKTHIDALFGVAHNIKGQGTSFGYPLVTRIGHTLCVLTRADRPLGEDDLNLVKAHLDALTIIIDREMSGEGTPTGIALADRLEKLVSEALGRA